MRAKSGTIDLDLNALRAFVFVVESGGIAEATRRTGAPKSTISRQVRDLERRLDERLLDRQGRGLAPTTAGRRLYETARTAVGKLETLRQGLAASTVTGRVRVHAPTILGRGLLQDLLAAFLYDHPTIDVEVVLSDRFVVAQPKETDVAFCVGIMPKGRHPQHHVGFVEARLYAAPSLLGELGAPRSPGDLPAWPILAQGCNPGGSTAWTLTNERGVAEEVTFRPRLVASDPDMLMASALAGRGIIRIASFTAEPHLRSGHLVSVLERHVAERHEVSVVTLGRARDPAVRCFATEMADRLQGSLATNRRS